MRSWSSWENRGHQGEFLLGSQARSYLISVLTLDFEKNRCRGKWKDKYCHVLDQSPPLWYVDQKQSHRHMSQISSSLASSISIPALWPTWWYNIIELILQNNVYTAMTKQKCTNSKENHLVHNLVNLVRIIIDTLLTHCVMFLQLFVEMCL